MTGLELNAKLGQSAKFVELKFNFGIGMRLFSTVGLFLQELRVDRNESKST